MGIRTAAHVIVGLGTLGLVAAPLTASARPIEKGHFHDVWSDTFDCDGTPVQEDGDVKGSYLFNQRGSNAFPYFKESVRGSISWTNLDTGGTFTNVFAATSSDHTIVDNGDGTATITVRAAGGSRYYDQDGRLVLKDPGAVRWAFDIDFNGTPGDPSDDTEVPDSFRIVKPSTGLNQTEGHDFCTDVREYTT